jgi:hypothetical protein
VVQVSQAIQNHDDGKTFSKIAPTPNSNVVLDHRNIELIQPIAHDGLEFFY